MKNQIASIEKCGMKFIVSSVLLERSLKQTMASLKMKAVNQLTNRGTKVKKKKIQPCMDMDTQNEYLSESLWYFIRSIDEHRIFNGYGLQVLLITNMLYFWYTFLHVFDLLVLISLNVKFVLSNKRQKRKRLDPRLHTYKIANVRVGPHMH